ncbi:MAG TPA: hypothetical protein DCZ01_01145 [Elusimicrobia bacterium]|nr:MAG: hypothetical protein A2X37_03245 [Elusimicrobia bacterium GWA2_66_18]OGR70345.1 MAG: hypothetical protein A2X40_04210 [Elusimicrobia bacterium GWC2_65_9]HAZ07139.1 hypothetical protein [Elusimicrobiota bacterium]
MNKVSSGVSMLTAAFLLSGCAGSLAGGTLGQGLAETAVPVAGRGSIDLNLCLYYSPTARGVRRVLDRPGLGVMIGLDQVFQSVKVRSSLEDSAGCDLMGEVNDPTVFKQPYFEMYSARSKKYLMRAVTQNYANWRYGDSLYTAFNKDAPLYAHIAVERDPSRAQTAQAAPAAPARPRIVSDVDSPDYRLPERPADFALVIGIEKYKDLPEAEFGARDAEAVKEHLLALGYPERNIIHLTGENATRTGLQKYLEEWLPRNVSPESTVFFYYSGHGAPDVKTGEAFLVPWDGDPSFLQSTAYPVKQLYEALGRLKARRVVVALDSCFSGAGGRSVLARGMRPLVPTMAVTAPSSDKIVILAAASGEEVTGSLPEQGHGMFTYHLLKAFSGKATVKGVFDYLKPKVQDGARRQNREQTPQLLGDGAVHLR